ncbi:hypothetical protein CRYUN_Cryun05aG0222200 [Craigia yunnanensis]
MLTADCHNWLLGIVLREKIWREEFRGRYQQHQPELTPENLIRALLSSFLQEVIEELGVYLCLWTDQVMEKVILIQNEQ